MDKLFRVTYHRHSGFSVRVGATLLVFDYWRGEGGEMPEHAAITQNTLEACEKVYVFVSNARPDHYDPVIYDWKDAENPDRVTYIIAEDMPPEAYGIRIRPGMEIELDANTRVKAYESTDIGVSLLVTAYGVRMFYAGNLNLWHWCEESSIMEIEQAEMKFRSAVAPLIGQQIDLCMFPVDPRQGFRYSAGADYFILSVFPRIFVPMQFWNRSDVLRDFKRTASNDRTVVYPMVKEGICADIEMKQDTFTIYEHDWQKALDRAVPTARSRLVPLTDGLAEEDANPFSNAANPVSFFGQEETEGEENPPEPPAGAEEYAEDADERYQR